MNVELLEREPSGEYCALVSIDDDVAEVTRRFGSWSTVPDEAGKVREILPQYAAILQSEVKRLERKR